MFKAYWQPDDLRRAKLNTRIQDCEGKPQTFQVTTYGACFKYKLQDKTNKITNIWFYADRNKQRNHLWSATLVQHICLFNVDKYRDEINIFQNVPLTCVHLADCHQHHRGQAAGRRKHRPQCGDWVWRWEETHFGQRRDQRSLLQWGRAQLDLKLELKKTSGRMLQSNYKLLIILSLSLLSISILCLTPLPIKKSSSTKLSSWQWVELTKTSLGHSWFIIVTSFLTPMFV